MTLFAEQVERIQLVLQDLDSSPANLGNITRAHQESMQKLARKDAFTNIQWLQAVAGQALYVLPTQAVSFMQVIYNEHALRYATEQSLDRRYHGFEALSGEPKYWTTDNQNPNTIRLIPAPVRTGLTTPAVPPAPLLMPLQDNIVVFLSEDPASQVQDSSDPLPTVLDWDDILVWLTARMLAERETPNQNLPVAQILRNIEALWERYVHYD